LLLIKLIATKIPKRNDAIKLTIEVFESQKKHIF